MDISKSELSVDAGPQDSIFKASEVSDERGTNTLATTAARSRLAEAAPIDKTIIVSLQADARERAMFTIRKIVEQASLTYRPPTPSESKPTHKYYPSHIQGVIKTIDRERSEKSIDSSTRTKSRRKHRTRAGLVRWHAENKQDYSYMLKTLLRSGRGKDEPLQGHGKKVYSEMTEFIQIPISWYSHIKRTYRGKPRTYPEAVQILGYVTSKYVSGQFGGELLHVSSTKLRDLFGLTEDAEQAAVKYLVENNYLCRLVILGFVPWNDSKKGSWRFLIPRYDKLIGITYR